MLLIGLYGEELKEYLGIVLHVWKRIYGKKETLNEIFLDFMRKKEN